MLAVSVAAMCVLFYVTLALSELPLAFEAEAEPPHPFVPYETARLVLLAPRSPSPSRPSKALSSADTVSIANDTDWTAFFRFEESIAITRPRMGRKQALSKVVRVRRRGRTESATCRPFPWKSHSDHLCGSATSARSATAQAADPYGFTAPKRQILHDSNDYPVIQSMSGCRLASSPCCIGTACRHWPT
jgi:hypothetical protein